MKFLKHDNEWIKKTWVKFDKIDKNYTFNDSYLERNKKYLCIGFDKLKDDSGHISSIDHPNVFKLSMHAAIIYGYHNNNIVIIKDKTGLNYVELIKFIDIIPKYDDTIKKTKILLSRNNPDGYKLEDILQHIIDDIKIKSDYVKNNNNSLSELIIKENKRTINLLSNAILVQTELYEILNKALGPNKGPYEPRV